MIRDKVTISLSIFLGAFAALFATLPLYLHYPIIPYLRFEAAEIPVVLAFFILGPEAAFLPSAVYWVILLLIGEFTPIGPTMKFVAVLTMILGLWIGFKLHRSPRTCLIIGSCLGCLFRVLAMSVFNYVIAVMMFPEFIEVAVASISAVLGMELLSSVLAIIMVLVFTAIFNVIHVILSIVPAYFLVKYMAKIKGGGIPILGKSWYFEMVKAASRQAHRQS